ncbi:MAG TPA: beta-propeller fold lactonase family protein [Verrucomicrobiae bacterium]|nr:beta-propeller fold lactonase family protein [Verrucomicrobiae bacterium]
MSKLWAWLLGLAVLVAIAFLVACGTIYNSSTDGLVLVTSQYSSLVETFSFSLGSGHVQANQNPPYDTAYNTCVLNGIPSSIVTDPAGNYAYMILLGNQPGGPCGATSTPTGILAYKINSNGAVSQVGSLIPLAPLSLQPCIDGSISPSAESVAVVPSILVMDTSGKFLYVADSSTADGSGNGIPGAISVFSIGSGGSLTEVTGSPFTPPNNCSRPPVNIVTLATTPMVPPPALFGQAQSVCSPPSPFPTSEYLYAVDSNLIGGVWEFQVNTSTGALGNPPGFSAPVYTTAGSTPMGVTVDPCSRYVYVANNISNNVYGYKICTGTTTNQLGPPCTTNNGQMFPILNPAGSTGFTLANGGEGPTQLVVDVYGNYLYVLDSNSNTISPFQISSVTGSLKALNPATVATGVRPTTIVIRRDDNWMFVTDFIAGTVSQFAIAPATGGLSPQLPITTDNYPWGVAVK